MAGNDTDDIFTVEQMPLCRPITMTTSAGILVGDHPDQYNLPILLFQIVLIFFTCRLVHAVLRHLQLPNFMSHIITSVLLGPSFLCRIPAFRTRILSDTNALQQNVIGTVGYMFFLFMIGVKTDISMIPKTGKKAFTIAIVGTLLPLVGVHLMGAAMRHGHPEKLPLRLLISTSNWSTTSYINVALLLSELNLLTSKLGRLAMSASLIAVFLDLILSAVVSFIFIIAKFHSPVIPAAIVASVAGFLVVLVYVLRPFVLWLMKRTPEGSLLGETCFVTVLLLALVCGLITEVMGYHLTLGPFLLGLALPGGAPLGTTIVERLEQLISGILLPLFLMQAGLETDIDLLMNVKSWVNLELLLMGCVVFKFVGVVLPCLYYKMPLGDAVVLGFMMNIKGIFEVEALWRWREAQVVDDTLHSATVLSIILVGSVTSALVKNFYRPEDRFVAHKRRTIQNTKRSDELRVLACIHNQDNVNPFISLLEASHPSQESPLSVYLLHLVQLVGRTDAVLVAHSSQPKSSSSADSDRVVNAFHFFAQQHHDHGVSVQPYICLSPYITMHSDICSLALDKKVSLIIIPFHKNVTLEGTVGVANPAIQAINVNVLTYAPCSVAILVDHGLTSATTAATAAGGQLKMRVAVYFLGGPDDREALAYAARMAGDSSTGMTMVRFLLPEEMREGDQDEWLDDEVVRQFRHDMVDGRRVVYREEVVTDGEGTVAVIKETSGQFSLLIVGRREGMKSPLTAGMSMWSEYPELGVIGDLLASSDFQASTLVVQQQLRVGSGGQADSPKHTLLNKNQHQVVMPPSN